MLRIYKDDETLIKTDGWDYPLEELPYLLEEHNGEAFVLMEDRLWEAEEPTLNLNR